MVWTFVHLRLQTQKARLNEQAETLGNFCVYICQSILFAYYIATNLIILLSMNAGCEIRCHAP
jgi:hypothetical protein